MATIFAEYAAKFANSAKLWERARKLMPSGINHDVRYINPFPLYMDHAQGCRKWDVDGHEFIDLCTGHGSIILGHGHPAILKALHEAVDKYTHPAAPTPAEVRWAELIVSIVPCAEMVRFPLSGTEATMLAMRIARAHTGRDIIVKIRNHFHGWHDYAMIEYLAPHQIPSSTGVPKVTADAIRAVPLHDLTAMEAALAPKDVAAVILEADGPSGGAVPTPPGFLQGLRDLTRRYDTLLIFDEVITGFRMTPGGAQEYYGVTPDMATYAKAVCGGVPGGAAVAGRAEIMGDLTFHPTTPSTIASGASGTRERSARTPSPPRPAWSRWNSSRTGPSRTTPPRWRIGSAKGSIPPSARPGLADACTAYAILGAPDPGR
jgi:glutamate-1-semialdehyde 2,1-aminomutase